MSLKNQQNVLLFFQGTAFKFDPVSGLAQRLQKSLNWIVLVENIGCVCVAVSDRRTGKQPARFPHLFLSDICRLALVQVRNLAVGWIFWEGRVNCQLDFWGRT